ncbi:polyubiquitin-like isoform X1 [Acipenser oxyrinchus oxyrinchus]|uniref:Polyubiquitin-like isoform X1 n=1 Tax=Acipenser oxyrinchus oxyrinchus TaxID=40147 RepID=A0AAD8CTH5_ACIOX|nr:polyubiquitin-like isoform X1 [Acipenser oxyrinchus oxyrinchus]
MQITVTTLTGTCYPMEMDPSATVAQLKQQIERRVSVPAFRQKLAMQKNGRKELEDEGRRLTECGLEHGDTVLVLVTEPESMQVFLRNDKGKTHTYEIFPGETVTEFRQKVYRVEKVPPEQQVLLYESKPLQDGRKLEDYNISPNTTITLNLRLRGG